MADYKHARWVESALKWTARGIFLGISWLFSVAPQAGGQPPAQVVSLPPCQSSGQVVNVDISTGPNVPPGQPDPRWQLIAVPNQTGTFPAYSTVTDTAWAGALVLALTNAHWLQRIQNPSPQPDAGGNYVYRLRFNLNPALYSSIQIVGQYAADNVAIVQLNGVTQSSCFGMFGNDCFGYGQSLNITSGFVNGINNLDIVVTNQLASGGQMTITGAAMVAKLQATCLAPCAQPPSGMVAWWTLDEPPGATAVNDVAPGFNNVGTPRDANGGATTISSVPGPPSAGPVPVTAPPLSLPSGQVNSALYFYGPYIEVPDHPDINFGNGSLSIDAWVRPVQVGPTFIQPIVDKLQLGLFGSSGYALYVQNNQLKFTIVTNPIFSLFTNYTSPANSIPFSVWTHVAVTVQAGTSPAVQLYLNGSPATTTPATPPATVFGASSNAVLWIGKSRLTPSQGGFGEIAIDELEIFNRALMLSEIQSIFSAGSAGKCKLGCTAPPAGMVGWWPLDELTGTTSSDTSGLSNHGTWVGNPTPTPGKVAGALNLGSFTLDYVKVPNPSNNSLDFGTTGDFSIDAWINTTFVFGNAAIVGKLSGSPVRGYAFFVDQAGPLGLYMAGNLGLQAYSAPNSGNLQDGQWHHVAVTVKRSASNGGHFYVDGNQVNTFNPTLTPGSISTATDLHLGNMFAFNTNMPWVGRLDEIEIFNRELSAAEVQSIYVADYVGKCKPAISPLPDFVVRDLVVTGPLTEGNFVVTFRIANEGMGAIDRRVNHEVRLVTQGGSRDGTLLETITTNALGAGASQRFTVPFKIMSGPVQLERFIRVIADSEGRVVELNERNNIGESVPFRF